MTQEDLLGVAKEFGAPVQVYDAEKIKSQYKLFKKYEKFNFFDYLNLYKYCKKKNLLFMTTLFDTENIRKYDKIIDVYKI